MNDVSDVKNPSKHLRWSFFVNVLNGLLFSQYKLHHRCSTGLYIGLWKYWNFQSEAKKEQIIAIVTTRSLSCCYLNSSDWNSPLSRLSFFHFESYCGKGLVTTHIIFAIIELLGDCNELYMCIINLQFLIMFYNFWVAPVYNFAIIQE